MLPDLPLHWLADSPDRAVKAITFSLQDRVSLLKADDQIGDASAGSWWRRRLRSRFCSTSRPCDSHRAGIRSLALSVSIIPRLPGSASAPERLPSSRSFRKAGRSRRFRRFWRAVRRSWPSRASCFSRSRYPSRASPGLFLLSRDCFFCARNRRIIGRTARNSRMMGARDRALVD